MNTIIAVPLDVELAEFIGKRGSVNGLTFYNRKSGSDVIVALAPSSVDEKFYALPEALLMADQIVVSTKNLDKLFGEVLVACALLDKKVIFTRDNDIGQFLSGVSPTNFAYSEKESLLHDITSFEHPVQKGDTRIDVDKSFNVKGVGTVVLGVVRRGVVHVHDTLHASSGKSTSVRSIQSQDQDIQEAGPGTRVGLALKNFDADGLSKGDTLSNPIIKRFKSATVKLKTSGFVSEKPDVGKRYGIATGFSYVEATVESINADEAKLKFEKPIALELDDEILVVRGTQPRVFASGRVLQIHE